MRPSITVLTLAVRDLERAVAFYRDGLGWPTQGIVGQEIENGAVAFFKLESGLVLALWPQGSLAADAGLPTGGAYEPTSLSLGHNVGSKEEVDSVIETALKAGGMLVRPAHDQVWGGYSGYFSDPDGHLWEVAWNPSFDSLG